MRLAKLPRHDGADLLAFQLKASGIKGAVREFRFHKTRRWRIDVFFPLKALAIEVDGWGRHQTFKGFTDDCEKACEIAIAGYRLMKVTPQQVKSGAALIWIERALA
jgi:hypothetical protein